MKKDLFDKIALNDLQRLSELYEKGWTETSDFNEAVDSLLFSLSAYLQSSLEEEDYGRKAS
jgi:hypothetical protein